MKQFMHPEHPDITEEMWGEIDKVIEKNGPRQNALIGVLRECQDVVGYLPIELMDYIGWGMDVSRSEVFAVASFYSLFSMEPKGRHKIRVCMGTACYVKGIKEVLQRISNTYKIREGETTEDRRFSLEAVRCLGACGLAPVVVIDQDTHGDVTSDKILNILENYQ
jgi:NADH-quinone oxidoreductase subunit E